MRWTVQQIAAALGVEAPAGLDAVAGVAGVSIDSRTIGAGELFIAIHGPRHDGHAHVAGAFERGAVAGVVARARLVEYTEAQRGKLFGVDDTLAALQQLAQTACRNWRSAKSGRRVAGITGSTGKTTTKEILAALLATRLRVLKNEGNLNNEFGVPLTLLRLEDEHEAAVLELGMSHAGEIAQLAKICEPEIGVVTCVAPVHLEFFASVEEIAKAKKELIENLANPRGGGLGARANSTAVLNADDVRVMKFAEGFQGKVVTFGFNEGADFRAEDLVDRGVEGSSFDFVRKENGKGERPHVRSVLTTADGTGRELQSVRMELALAGRHNVMNALAALAAASEWGVGAEEAKQALAILEPAAMRGQVLKFAEGFAVINDSYNSNPVALESMVNLLAATQGYQRRILAAGEMLELGAESAQLHREVGHAAANAGLDWIIGVQGMAEEFLIGAEEAGVAPTRTQFFDTSEEAGKYLSGFLQPGDLLLVKGSRGVKMERIVEALTAKFTLAEGRG